MPRDIPNNGEIAIECSQCIAKERGQCSGLYVYFAEDCILSDDYYLPPRIE